MNNIQSNIVNLSSNDIYECNKSFTSNLSSVHGITILQINARSINSNVKFDSFTNFLTKIKFKVDVLVVSETCLLYELVGIRNIPSYTQYPSCRTSKGGGLSVFISSNLQHNFIEKIDSSFFSITIEISGINNTTIANKNSLVLTSYYRPPDNRNLSVFLRHLQNIFEASTNKNCLIVGDININTLNSSTHSISNLNKYKNLISSYDFEVINNITTRKSSGTLLDHVVCNFHHNTHFINNTVNVDFSDHSAIFTHVQCHPTPIKQTIAKKITNFALLRTKLNEKLSTISHSEFSNPNDLLNIFIDAFKKSFSECTESVMKTVSSKKPICPWMNPHLQSIIKKKDNFIKTNKNVLHVPWVKTKLGNLDSDIVKWQWVYKNNYHEMLFNNSLNNRQKTWKNINNILGRQKHQHNPIKKISVNGTDFYEDYQKASVLNSFFTGIGKKLAQDINSIEPINKYQTLHFTTDSIFLEPTNVEEVLNLLGLLDSNKSPGYDEISALSIKTCADVIAPILVSIINLTISTGIYPDCLKIACITPLHKADSKSDPSNYRPISILPTLNKIFEKILYSRILNFLNKTKFLYPRQYGFRQRSGTHTATYELLDKILMDMDKNKVVSALFLDIKKAFDCVDHALLLHKLSCAGIRGLALQLIESYLKNRKQCVVVGKSRSDLQDIDLGVPQGSVLGPLLFLVYINDIHKLPLKGLLSLFADDSGVFCSNMTFYDNVVDLTHDLSIINDFLEINKLTLNVSKTKVMHFKKINRSTQTPLVFKGETIQVVNTFKYLGLLIDERLSWRPHISNLCSKLAALSGVLRKLKHFIPKHVLMNIYYSLGHSHLTYLVGAWGGANKTDLKQLQTLQNRCLKNICKLTQRHSTSDLYRTHCKGVLNISSLYQANVCKFIHGCVNNTSHNAIDLPTTSHRYNTRSRKPLQRIPTKTVKSSKAISISGCLMYNNLPIDIRSAPPHTFLSKIKIWLSLKQFPG